MNITKTNQTQHKIKFAQGARLKKRIKFCLAQNEKLNNNQKKITKKSMTTTAMFLFLDGGGSEREKKGGHFRHFWHFILLR